MSILPPATIGILGGGQLGRMTALAARSMGYSVQVLDPSADCAARPVVDRVVVGGFDDPIAAADLARACDVITIEIEQIAPTALAAAREYAPVRPGAHVLAMVQDRSHQKRWLSNQGIPLGPYADVTTVEELRAATTSLGSDLFIKACQGGYDGRSQIRLTSGDDIATAFSSLGGRPAVAEQSLPLALEISVLVARRPAGETVVFPIAINHHERQILAWSHTPADLAEGVALRAEEIARHIANALSLEGILAVEMFLLADGRLLVNELAPRPHNSFHATELACPTSQFEQLVRTACDLPLGAVTPVQPAAIVNLFGESWEDGRVPRFDRALEVPGTRLFLYGKSGARRGRKMGHIAAVGASADEALRRVQLAFSAL